jgi:fatty-acid desaturase
MIWILGLNLHKVTVSLGPSADNLTCGIHSSHAKCFWALNAYRPTSAKEEGKVIYRNEKNKKKEERRMIMIMILIMIMIMILILILIMILIMILILITIIIIIIITTTTTILIIIIIISEYK